MRMSALIPVAGGHGAHSAVALACRLLAEGHIIAVPTDTIYGFASNAQNITAVRKLYHAKGRASVKPIAVCVGEVEEVSLWGKSDMLPDGVLRALLPGPVTVVLERTPPLNPELNPGTSKVGIRVPNHPFVRDIVRRTGMPLALTSANSSSELSSLSPEEFRPLWPHLAAIFDGGNLGSLSSVPRAGSTIVDLSVVGHYSVVRNGSALVSTLKTLQQFGLKPLESVDQIVL